MKLTKYHLYYVAIAVFSVCCFIAGLIYLEVFQPESVELTDDDERQTLSAVPPEKDPPFPAAERSDQSPVVEILDSEPAGVFTPKMQQLVEGIYAGRPVRVLVGESQSDYLFRAKKVTMEDFQISTASDADFPAQYEVFEGRRLTGGGALTESIAALAVVNDTLSMAYSTEDGDFLIERDESGQMVQIQLSSTEPNSLLGRITCTNDGYASGSIDASEGLPLPRTNAVRVELAGSYDENDPSTSGALASHPYFRLGSEYDASLKDMNVLMISGSTQTGASSNFSSRAASYFSYAAILRDVYERQLGLRFQLQELILIADEPGLSPEDDVEYDDSVTPNNTGSASDDLLAVKTWVDVNRPQASYGWGHVMAWTLVNSDVRNTVGWAYNSGYGTSDRGFTVNEREMTWGIIVHELGHNVGANHTIGGAMNSVVSRSNPKEDFFTENETSGGFTAATEIYDYMSNPVRSYIYGPAELRNPLEIPFGVDDAASTAVDTAVTFNPLANDLSATPLFGNANNLRLIEVGQIFPKTAGSVSASGNEITFVPEAGFTGNVWFSYTLGGDVGNGGRGWLHSADVILTVGGSGSDPNLNPSISTTDDVLKTDFSGEIRINPLLNDEGDGRLWGGGVEGIGIINGVTQAGDYSDGAFHLVSAIVSTGNGTVALETMDVTRGGVNTQDNTGYLVYTPGVSEPSQVVIEYTVEDASGNQSTGNIFLNFSESVVVSSDVTKLVEREGRVATISVTRSGSTTAAEWVDFMLGGTVKLIGADSDVAISGHDKFDPSTRLGRMTIPAGQASAEILVSVMEDAVEEGAEALIFNVVALESLVVSRGQGALTLDTTEEAQIETVFFSQNFDSFPNGDALADGWTVDTAQPGVWTARSGPTPSGATFGQTGPLNDHTQGDSSGKYLFRESSFGNINQRADLLSPILDLSGLNAAALEFYYHMYDDSTDLMGDLHLDVFSNGSWHLDVMPPLIGEQQIEQDDPWRRVYVDLSQYATADFRARIRSITGGGYLSDMAIDDFLIGELFSQVSSPVILGQPQSRSVLADDPVYLSVVAPAYPSPTYQWKKDGVNIGGATQSVFYLESFSSGDAGEYSCEVTSGTTVTSSIATLTLVQADDVDSDAISDAWERLYFDSTDSIDGSGDFDGDGLLDFFEYIFDSNPSDPSSRGSAMSVAPTTDSSDIVFRWEVKEGFVIGVDYLFEITTSLTSWTQIPEETYTVQTTTEAGVSHVELSIPKAYADQVFLRLVRP